MATKNCGNENNILNTAAIKCQGNSAILLDRLIFPDKPEIQNSDPIPDTNRDTKVINPGVRKNNNTQYPCIHQLFRHYTNSFEYFRPTKAANEHDIIVIENTLCLKDNFENYFVNFPFPFSMSNFSDLREELVHFSLVKLPTTFSPNFLIDANQTVQIYDNKDKTAELTLHHDKYVSKDLNYTHCTTTIKSHLDAINVMFTFTKSEILSLLEISSNFRSLKVEFTIEESISVYPDFTVRSEEQKKIKSGEIIKTSFGEKTWKDFTRCTILNLYEHISNGSKTESYRVFNHESFSNYSEVRLTRQTDDFKEISSNSSSYIGNDYNITRYVEQSLAESFTMNKSTENRSESSKCIMTSFKTKTGESENISNSTKCVADTGHYLLLLTLTNTPNVIVRTETTESVNRDESVKKNLIKTEWLSNSITYKTCIVRKSLFTSINQTTITVTPDSFIVVNTSNIYAADYVVAENILSDTTAIQNLYMISDQPTSTVNPNPTKDIGTSESMKAFELNHQTTSRY